jgi:antitoxin component HigA of HigAB toxin-antitoxin module
LCVCVQEGGAKLNTKLRKAMADYGDTYQDLANYLGLRMYASISRKLNGETGWKKEQIKKVCRRYKMTKEELGL